MLESLADTHSPQEGEPGRGPAGYPASIGGNKANFQAVIKFLIFPSTRHSLAVSAVLNRFS